ncbi:MAG: hypothetical protein K5859_05915 [Atopobiaceae bacterium]|nr:hypothetical protein [Atopobiaceae bacterium]
MNARIIAAMAALLVCSALCGCGDSGRGAPSNQQDVSDVMEQQMQAENGDAASAPQDQRPFTTPSTCVYADEDIDVDLTAMGPDMVYATVYDMVTNAPSYEGKVVRITGPYYHLFYEPTQTDYYGVIIQDATACCSQGFEFVWDDGSHIYPEEYPAENAEVVVTGIFELYTEGEQSYVHLIDASLELA